MNYIQCYQLFCFDFRKIRKEPFFGGGAEQVFTQNVQFSVKLWMSLILFTCRRCSTLILSKLATLIIFAFIFHTFHNMQIDGNGLQFVRMTFILATVIGVNLRQNSWRFESKQLLFTWKVLRTLGKRHNLPIFWQWSTISVPKKEANVDVVIETTSDG